MTELSISDRIMQQRVALCLDEPFFGVLLMRLKVVEVQPGQMGINTMATDGETLWWCAAYVGGLSKPKLKGLLVHEVLHNALLHHTRRGTRDPKKWNIAADAAIDHIAKDAGFDVPDSFADDPKWDWAKGLTVETIYARLPVSPPRSGQGKGEGGGEGEGKPRPGGVKDAASGNKSAVEADMKLALKQAEMTQRSHDRRRGKDSGWLKGVIEETCVPKVRWQDVLRRFLSPTTPFDQSWARPSRRYAHQGLYLPGTIKHGTGEGVVFFDSSGSCTADWPQFRGELEAIFEDVAPERVSVLMCDTKVQNIQVYEQGDPFIPKVYGGGGSDFRPAFEAVDKMPTQPQWAVVLSDMEINFPAEAPPYPVLAVSTTGKKGPAWAENIRI